MESTPSTKHRRRIPVRPIGRARILSLALLSGVAFFALSPSVTAQMRDQIQVDAETVTERIDAALAAVSARIDAAVASGRLTAEEGEERLRQARADLIWKAALSIDPDQWPEPLQALILELRPGATIEQFAEWARNQRQKTAEGAKSAETDKEEPVVPLVPFEACLAKVSPYPEP